MIKKLFILFTIVFFSSCKEEPVAVANNVVEAGQANEQLIKQYFETFNKHEWEKLANMYTPQAVFLDPSFGSDTVVQSRSQVAAKYTELEQMITGLRDSIIHINSIGNNKVVVEFESAGKDTAGRPFKLPICTIFTMEAGKIARDYTYYDNN